MVYNYLVISRKVLQQLPSGFRAIRAANEPTVHEMARDEARHGKALEGLLKRYFK